MNVVFCVGPENFKISCVLLLFFVNFIRGDWVEITQIDSSPVPTKPSRIFTTHASVLPTFGTTTTESTFENFLSRPEIKPNAPNNSTKSKQTFKSVTPVKEEKNATMNTRQKVQKTIRPHTSVRTKIEGLTEFSEKNDAYLEADEMPASSRRQAVMEDEANGQTYTGFLPFLKTIQSTLMRNTHRHFTGKMNLLKNLRESLVYNLQEKIIDLWGPSKKQDRSAREYKDDYHVEFPSNEGALITIAFLTFAVALIKLVLQLLNNYKNNNAAGLIGRRKRSATYSEETINILRMLEEYKLK